MEYFHLVRKIYLLFRSVAEIPGASNNSFHLKEVNFFHNFGNPKQDNIFFLHLVFFLHFRSNKTGFQIKRKTNSK